MNRYILTLVASIFIITGSSCTTTEQPSFSNFQNLSFLLSQYPLAPKSSVTHYLEDLIKQLQSVLPYQLQKRTAVTVYILESLEPHALTLQPQTLAISQGLLRAAETEAELAFVVAHELSHIALSHNHISKQAEWEADALAIKIISRAGWNPISSIDAIQRFAQIEANEAGSYPSASERVVRLKETLKSLPQIGTISSNQFNTQKKRLR